MLGRLQAHSGHGGRGRAVDANPLRPAIVQPNDVAMPPDGLNIRFPDSWKDQELRSHIYKLPAAVGFARANSINRVTHQSPNRVTA